MKGHMRKPWVSQEAEREGESMALSLSCDYCGKECTRQGRKASVSLGWDSLNNFRGLWDIRVVSSCLV